MDLEFGYFVFRPHCIRHFLVDTKRLQIVRVKTQQKVSTLWRNFNLYKHNWDQNTKLVKYSNHLNTKHPKSKHSTFPHFLTVLKSDHVIRKDHSNTSVMRLLCLVESLSFYNSCFVFGGFVQAPANIRTRIEFDIHANTNLKYQY